MRHSEGPSLATRKTDNSSSVAWSKKYSLNLIFSRR